MSITTPYDPGGEHFRSPKDPKIARAEILFDVQSNDVPIDVGSAMRGIAKRANSPTLQVELGGFMFTDATQPASELVGVADLVVLVSRAGKTTRPNAQRATEVLHRLGRIPIPFVRQMVTQKVAETARAENVGMIDVPFFERAATF